MQIRFLSVAVVVLAVSRIVLADPDLPRIPEKSVVKVTDFGAFADGQTDAAPAIDSAIASLSKGGGGTVELPAGQYVAGPIHLKSNIRLAISEGATLKMLPLDRYPGGSKAPEDFISAQDVNDIAVGGGGVIDGQGEPWWPHYKGEGFKRPIMLHVTGCQRVLVENITLRNSPMFHMAMGGPKTEQITVRHVTVRAPSSGDKATPSHNTDACNVGGKHVLIEDCDISCGDDNYTCGGGTSDVLLRRNKYGDGHGLSLGSRTNGGIDHITVEDCTFNGTGCGIRIKSDRGRGGEVHHLVYRNLKMTNVGIPILIYGTYFAQKPFRDLTNITGETAATYPTSQPTELTPNFHDITFSNITATTPPGSRAGLIWGLPEQPVKNVILENIHITADKPFGVFFVDGMEIKDCKIVTPEGTNQISNTQTDLKITP